MTKATIAVFVAIVLTGAIIGASTQAWWLGSLASLALTTAYFFFSALFSKKRR
jgi:general stress protein CsbA